MGDSISGLNTDDVQHAFVRCKQCERNRSSRSFSLCIFIGHHREPMKKMRFFTKNSIHSTASSTKGHSIIIYQCYLWPRQLAGDRELKQPVTERACGLKTKLQKSVATGHFTLPGEKTQTRWTCEKQALVLERRQHNFGNNGGDSGHRQGAEPC